MKRISMLDEHSTKWKSINFISQSFLEDGKVLIKLIPQTTKDLDKFYTDFSPDKFLKDFNKKHNINIKLFKEFSGDVIFEIKVNTLKYLF